MRVSSNRQRAAGWAILLVLLLAAGTRILGAAERPVWTDEGFVAWITGETDPGAMVDKIEVWDRHPPLYVFWLAGWRQIAGDSRIALRFWAIASGLLATALVYRIGADTFGAQAGRYAALLFATLGMAIYYSQEIRDYGWLMLSVCLMSFFFLRYLSRPRGWLLVGYALSLALMLYTVYLGALVVAIQGGIALLWRGARRDKLRLGMAWIAAGLLFAPWLIVVLRQFDRVHTGIRDAPGTYATTLDNTRLLIGFLWGGQWALTGALFLWGAALVVRRTPLDGKHLLSRASPGTEAPGDPSEGPSMALTGALEGASGRESAPSGAGAARGAVFSFPFIVLESGRVCALYLLLAGGGLFAVMMLANLVVAVVAARTLVMLTPFIMLVCGAGLSHVDAPLRPLFAGLLVIVSLAETPVIQPRLEYDKVADALAAQVSPGDLVILETGWDDNPFQYELSLALPDDAEIVRTLPWVDPATAIPVAPQVEGAIRAYRRVWVVQWLQPPQVLPWLAEQGDYTGVITRRISTGAQYADLYPDDPVVTVALFERPDLDRDPVIFGDLFALRDAVLPERVAAGGALHVDLWWSAVAQPTLDYSVGVYLMRADADLVRAQHDGPPGETPTSQWSPETDAPIFDRHTLALPENLPPGTYRVMARVYWFGDQEPLLADGQALTLLGEVRVD
jgi:4-amino-4-deoxy-L-arabinose transferase-like glycosyltransferase